MKKLLYSMMMGAVVFAAVGALIAITLPHIATFLAAHSIIGASLKTILVGWDPLWPEVISLGMVGALVPPCQKLWDTIFGAAKAPNQNAVDALQAKVAQLNGREQMLEYALAATHAPSRTVQNVVAAGPRADAAMNDALTNLMQATPTLERAEAHLRNHQQFVLADKLSQLSVDAGNMYANDQGWRAEGSNATTDTALPFTPVSKERMQSVLGDVHAKLDDASLAKDVGDVMRAVGVHRPSATTHVSHLQHARKDALLHSGNSATVH